MSPPPLHDRLLVSVVLRESAPGCCCRRRCFCRCWWRRPQRGWRCCWCRREPPLLGCVPGLLVHGAGGRARARHAGRIAGRLRPARRVQRDGTVGRRAGQEVLLVQELRIQEEVGPARHATPRHAGKPRRGGISHYIRASTPVPEGRERTSAKKRGTAKRARAARSGWTQRLATPATYLPADGGWVGWLMAEPRHHAPCRGGGWTGYGGRTAEWRPPGNHCRRTPECGSTVEARGCRVRCDVDAARGATGALRETGVKQVTIRNRCWGGGGGTSWARAWGAVWARPPTSPRAGPSEGTCPSSWS